MQSPQKELLPIRDGLFHLGTVSASDEFLALAEKDPRGFGLKFLAEGNAHSAVPLLLRSLQIEPADFEVLLGLGQALVATSRWTEAEPFLAEAVALRPDSLAAQFYYGEALLKVGKFAQAETALGAAMGARSWRKWRNWHDLVIGLKALLSRGKHRLESNPNTFDPAPKLAYASVRREKVDYARSCLTQAAPNPAWGRSERGRRLHVKNTPLISRHTKIFAIGSCFALEIRHELRRRGFDVFPKYHQVDFDPKTQILNSLPDSDNINHYDTFTIRQEIEQAFGERKYELSDFWQIEDRTINKVMGQKVVWQDPYRKNIYASDADGICDISAKIGRCVAEGVNEADVYVITLGLIEAWQIQGNGLHACTFPGVGGGGGECQTKLHLASFAENYENMRRVCELIFNRFPAKHIILTVSPVALGKTFTERDVVVANMESKCQLRAVAGQICREFPNVHYLPSYELFAYHDLFHDNGRHAARDGVNVVLDLFAKCFLSPEV